MKRFGPCSSIRSYILRGVWPGGPGGWVCGWAGCGQEKVAAVLGLENVFIFANFLISIN
jgi:hypothetical protein